MSNKLVYRVETESGDGMYADKIGILDSTGSQDSFTSYRPFPSENISKHLRKVTNRKDYLFGFANLQQVKNWILNPVDFEFLAENFKISVYKISLNDIVEDGNQLVYFQPNAKLIERQSLLQFS